MQREWKPADAAEPYETVSELAARLGIDTDRGVDFALPQPFVDDVRGVTGFYLPGQCVWSYLQARTFGAPVALTEQADAALDAYNLARGTHYGEFSA